MSAFALVNGFSFSIAGGLFLYSTGVVKTIDKKAGEIHFSVTGNGRLN